MNRSNTRRTGGFHGWRITAAAFLTFGLSVGVPYYNIPFFYDYFERTFGWSRSHITLGFPIAALLTIWAGPVLIPKFSPRKLILFGTAITALAFLGFGTMGGSLNIYYGLWVLYTIGYLASGPIEHQIIVSNWFRRKRGTAMGIVYVGVGLMGSIGSLLVKPITGAYGFRTALFAIGGMALLAWPLAIFILRDRPSELGLNPDGDDQPAPEVAAASHTYGFLLRNWSFWLLLIASFCSIGAIGAVNFHMKFVFLDAGFHAGEQLDSTWRTSNVLILWSSIAGRLSIGWFADIFSKKHVMTASYVLSAATIPLLLHVTPPGTPYLFAVLFGFAMGADYMLIPLMAAEQFGVNSLARAMAIILPVNTIGQTWFPYFVSLVREHYGSYGVAMSSVLVMAALGALAIAILPKKRYLAAPLVGAAPVQK
ncbi:MAG TPA: MFS transporter [Bryobacteraceae bacterium]|jgi:MFS family permease|nr:MFS transporter [Bryobacteraceae bacterium]